MVNEILKSITIKNKLHKKYLKSKNCGIKNLLFIKFKKYRNSISNLQKFCKKKYYTNFFSHNNVKNTWKGIKELINVKPNKSYFPTSILINNKCKTNPKAPIILLISLLRLLQNYPTEFQILNLTFINT